MNTREIFGDPYNGSICGIVKLYLYGSLDMRGRCEITYIRAMRKACYRAYSIVHFSLYIKLYSICHKDQTSAFLGKIWQNLLFLLFLLLKF